MENHKTMTSKAEKKQVDSIIKWIDSIAKIVVVITALLYIIGRSYTESYYAHMGIPTSNLPLTLQEFLFMSTKSLSFLKNAFSISFISVLSGFVVSVIVKGIKTLMDQLIRKFSKVSTDKEKGEPNGNRKETKREDKHDDIEVSKTSNHPIKKSKDQDIVIELMRMIIDWLKSNLLYLIPTFIVLVFIMLIPSAKASGTVDSEYAIQNAPLGRIVLNQSSIPELTPQVYITQKDTVLYDYGALPVIGTLGDNYLIVLECQGGNKTILSIPASDVVSINYITYVSLTPTPTSLLTQTPTLILNLTLIETATPTHKP